MAFRSSCKEQKHIFFRLADSSSTTTSNLRVATLLAAAATTWALTPNPDNYPKSKIQATH